jgi:radical SAM protein with 4Fe4S-binding SPASM domain
MLNRPIGDMPLSQFKAIIDEVHQFATVVLLHFQGEPLINSKLPEMVSYATSKGLVSEMSTNATLLSNKLAHDIVDSGIKKVIISIDSPNRHDFGFYRKGAEYSGVINAIEQLNLAKISKNSLYPIVIVELLAFRDNIKLIPEFKNLAKELNVDLARVKSANVPYGNRADYVPKNQKYSRYKLTNAGQNDFELRGSPRSRCSALWFSLTITHDGWVVPCCFDKSAYYIMGHIKFSTLSRIWNSKIYNNLRKRVIWNRPIQPICNECSQGRVTYNYVL